MRRLVGRLIEWHRDGPRLLPFLSVLVRAAFRPQPLAETVSPVVRERDSRPRVTTERDVVAFSVIRNGIENGYPFIEAYGSWLDTCSRIVILDGESTDGTRDALDALRAIDDRVLVESAPWPGSRAGGSSIAQFTEHALDRARRYGDTLIYLQADEIYPRELRALAAQPRSEALEFATCVNFWNSFDTVVANEFPMRYVRAFPSDADVHSLADGYSFELGALGVERSPLEILHYGWCFPVNILRKHVSHARLYRDNPVYRARGALAAAMLRAGSTERRLLDALAPGYRPSPFRGEHPPAVRHLLTLAAYDPAPGLELLERGAVW
ncbi:MAG: hypothetical protein ACTHKS_13420 [Gaiellaceae bacterium]